MYIYYSSEGPHKQNAYKAGHMDKTWTKPNWSCDSFSVVTGNVSLWTIVSFSQYSASPIYQQLRSKLDTQKFILPLYRVTLASEFFGQSFG